MAKIIKSFRANGENHQLDYEFLANKPTIPATMAELTDVGDYATVSWVENEISSLPIDSEMLSSSTNYVQNKAIKEYADKGDAYPIAYKTVSGSGTITAYKDATKSSSYDTIAVNSRGGLFGLIEIMSG